MSTDTCEAGQKRKREASPDLPEKRQALGDALSSSEQIRNPPALLEGEAADDWRRQLIQIMFPGTNVKPEKVLRDRDDSIPRPKMKGRKSRTDSENSLRNSPPGQFLDHSRASTSPDTQSNVSTLPESATSLEASENVSFILKLLIIFCPLISLRSIRIGVSGPVSHLDIMINCPNSFGLLYFHRH